MNTTRHPRSRHVPVVGWASDRDPLTAQVLCLRCWAVLPAVREVYPTPVTAAAAQLVLCAHCEQEPDSAPPRPVALLTDRDSR